jgi:EAL domain-containing protein (putative c-di-GMP-specific phosphodiesterase class I)/ActR/RegA family two-component response regulator
VATILVIDDEALARNAYTRLLSQAGHQVETAADGAEGLQRLDRRRYDVVLSDVQMPQLSGVEVLRTLRERGLSVPVVLMSGRADLDSAIQAVEHGAFRYLKKPFSAQQLLDVISRAERLARLARLKQMALDLSCSVANDAGSAADLESCFERGLDGLWMAFQPIVDATSGRLHGYEALLRTREGRLLRPDRFLDAAEQLGRLHELGRRARAAVAEAAARAPEACQLFVNLHASDLADDQLFDAGAPLGKVASRVVLELTERSSLEGIPDVTRRIAQLRKLGYRVAVDYLGAGYAGLSSVALLEPDVIKLDVSLVRDIDAQPTKLRVVQSMVELCRGLCMSVVCEGVETQAERDTLLRIGAELMQGFLYARPSPDFVSLAS